MPGLPTQYSTWAVDLVLVRGLRICPCGCGHGKVKHRVSRHGKWGEVVDRLDVGKGLAEEGGGGVW